MVRECFLHIRIYSDLMPGGLMFVKYSSKISHFIYFVTNTS